MILGVFASPDRADVVRRRLRESERLELIGIVSLASIKRASRACWRALGGSICDAEEAVDLYTRQCSLSVTARDVGVMARHSPTAASIP